MSGPPALSAQVVADAVAYLEEWIPARCRHTRTPGVQAAVWFDDGLVLSSATGRADLETGEPLRTDHLFRVASHSKMFTATAVLRLVESGDLRLDDTLGRWLPWIRDDGSPLADRTLGDLLSHGAGITRDGRDADHWVLTHPFLDADGLRRAVVEGAEVTPANVRFKYSNIGYSLVGAVIEEATGQSWRDHVSAELMEPLGLDDTFPDLDAVPSESLGRLATAHSSQSLGAARVPIDQLDAGAMSAATGVVSTASDLCRWASAQFLGTEGPLTDDSRRRMQRIAWSVEGADEGDYGLGTIIVEVGDRRLQGHGGGWPGHITRTMFDPEARLAVAVATNAIDGPAAEIATGAVKIIDLAGRNAARTRADGGGLGSDRRASAEGLCGRYATLWQVLDIAVLGDRLVGLAPTLPEPTATALELGMVDDTTLRIDAGSGYGAVGEEMRFELDADGRVRRIAGAGGVTLVPIDDLDLSDRVRLGSA